MEQQELPFATIRGQAFIEKPKDLFIPDIPLEVHLETFEGPLDLLLYLIKKQKFDIADLPIAPISKQYFQYIEQLERQDIDLSSEYLVMAATLAQIKSRLLLPKVEVEAEEDDPRAELVRRLQEYQSIKQAAELLEELPRQDRDFFIKDHDWSSPADRKFDDMALTDLIAAFSKVLQKQAAFEHHHIQRESVSMHDKINELLLTLNKASRAFNLIELIDVNEGRQGVVVTFLAILELLKMQKIACEYQESQLVVSAI
ncbi:segregation and condensation protein A [Colwellia sp. MEBiC06753]